MVAGRPLTDVYVMVNGRAMKIGFDNQNLGVLGPGEHFGGILENTRAAFTLKTEQTCRIAKIDAHQFEMMCDAFPDWSERLRTREKARRKEILEKLDYFSRKSVQEGRKSDRSNEDDDDDDLGINRAARGPDLSNEIEVTDDLVEYYADKNRIIHQNSIDSQKSFSNAPDNSDPNNNTRTVQIPLDKDLSPKSENASMMKKASEKSDEGRILCSPTNDQNLSKDQSKRISQSASGQVNLEDQENFVPSFTDLRPTAGRSTFLRSSTDFFVFWLLIFNF